MCVCLSILHKNIIFLTLLKLCLTHVFFFPSLSLQPHSRTYCCWSRFLPDHTVFTSVTSLLLSVQDQGEALPRSVLRSALYLLAATQDKSPNLEGVNQNTPVHIINILAKYPYTWQSLSDFLASSVGEWRAVIAIWFVPSVSCCVAVVVYSNNLLSKKWVRGKKMLYNCHICTRKREGSFCLFVFQFFVYLYS